MKTNDVLQKPLSIFESIGGRDPYFSTWQREIHPILCEVALNPDQIRQIFQQAEAGSRTALGRGIDTVKGAVDKVSDAWFNKFGGMLQQSAPVQAFDQKYEKLKQDIAAKNPKLAASLAKYGQFAKKNPNLHKFLLAIAGSVASALGVAVAGGVGAGALAVGTGVGIATGIINIADRLLQGQAASTAIGRGATAGVVAGLTAASIRAATDLVKGIDAVTTIRGSWKVTYDAVPGGHYQFFLKKEDYEKFIAAQDAIKSTVAKIDFMSNPDAYFAASNNASGENLKLVRKFFAMASTPEYQEAAMKAAKITIEPNVIQKAVGAVAKMAQAWNPVISAIVGQAAGGAGQQPAAGAGQQPAAAPAAAPATPPAKESKEYKKIRRIFESVESNLYDQHLKYQFKLMMEAEGDKKPGFFSRMAKKFTNKITADQIEKAWTDAGSPTDSEQIAKLMHDIGVNTEVIQKTYQDLSIPAATSIPSTDKTEPSISSEPVPAASAEPQIASEPAQPTEPAANATQPTTAEPQPTPGTNTVSTEIKTILDDPTKLISEFDAWLAAGNTVTPELKNAIKQALQQVGVTVTESRRVKLVNLIQETNKIQKQIKFLRKQL